MFIVPGFRGEGAHVQCGIPEVGLKDQSGHEALVPVLGVVNGAMGSGGRSSSSTRSGSSRFGGVSIWSPPTSDSSRVVSSQARVSCGHKPDEIVGCQISK